MRGKKVQRISCCGSSAQPGTLLNLAPNFSYEPVDLNICLLYSMFLKQLIYYKNIRCDMDTGSSVNRDGSNLLQQEPLPTFVNLSDRRELISTFDSEYQTASYADRVMPIVNRIYQSNSRAIVDSDFGQTFSANPEVLAHAMKLAKGTNVLEIAGASGENSIVLAHSGATNVYLNDINSIEIKSFEEMKKTLPSQIQSKLHSLPGSCFDILNAKPELEGNIGLILCRNLVHFFADEDHGRFFTQIAALLKNGGHAIISANMAQGNILQNPSQQTCARIVQCIVHDDSTGGTGCAILQDSVPIKVVNSSELLGGKSFNLYERNAASGYKWVVNRDGFGTLDPTTKEKVSNAFKKNEQAIKKIPYGRVQVMVGAVQCFTPETLANLCKKHGFIVETSFSVKKNGHLIDPKAQDIGIQTGVIIKK
jgi:SAM-dependent methyltransferase